MKISRYHKFSMICGTYVVFFACLFKPKTNFKKEFKFLWWMTVQILRRKNNAFVEWTEDELRFPVSIDTGVTLDGGFVWRSVRKIGEYRTGALNTKILVAFYD